MELSIIIPAHNEEKTIKGLVEEYDDFFQNKLENNFEIIIIPNGCKDKTVEYVERLKKQNKRVQYSVLDQGNKGKAVIQGFNLAEGEYIGFVDADGSTSPEAFYDLLIKMEPNDGAIASRWLKDSKITIKQPLKRRIAGRSFNFFVRTMLGLRFTDTQCGAKIFKKKAIKQVYRKLGITKWAFDIDLLYLMKRNNFKIKEVATEWKEPGNSHLNLVKATIEMFLALMRLRLIYSPFRFVVAAYDALPEKIKIHHKL